MDRNLQAVLNINQDRSVPHGIVTGARMVRYSSYVYLCREVIRNSSRTTPPGYVRNHLNYTSLQQALGHLNLRRLPQKLGDMVRCVLANAT